MTQWHADLDGTALAPGAEVTVLSHHHVVRVITSDTLLSESPDGQRQSAFVIDRTAGRIELALEDGQTVSLELVTDESLRPSPAATVFSQQKWMTH